MPALRPGLACSLALLLAAFSPAARADLVRLKNGGTIVADSWVEKDETLIIRQGERSIEVPRADVAEIVRQPAAPKPPRAGKVAGTPEVAPPPGQPPAPGVAPPAADLSTEEAERLIADLKGRIRDFPLARVANERKLIALLSRLGGEAYGKRDHDQARGRFQEALGLDEHNAGAQFGLAACYLAQGQDIYARSTLERALIDHPKDPDLLALMGEVYYGQERPEDAISAWQKAFAIRPDQVVRERIDKVQRELAIDRDYRRSDAAHFTIKYDDERAGPDLSREIVDYLEGQFSDLVQRFDYYPHQAIVVFLYPRQQFYDATQAGHDVTGLFDGKIRVPCGGLKQLDRESRAVLLHELAHAFITGKSGGQAPRWLQEGLAQRIEGLTASDATGAALAKEFQDRTRTGAEWESAFSYPSSLSFVEHLERTLGFPRLVDVLGAMGEGSTAEEAFETICRYSLQELRQSWGEDLVRRHLH